RTRSPLFPYTTLFRSDAPPASGEGGAQRLDQARDGVGGAGDGVVGVMAARAQRAPGLAGAQYSDGDPHVLAVRVRLEVGHRLLRDRKSTRLNSSHVKI